MVPLSLHTLSDSIVYVRICFQVGERASPFIVIPSLLLLPVAVKNELRRFVLRAVELGNSTVVTRPFLPFFSFARFKPGGTPGPWLFSEAISPPHLASCALASLTTGTVPFSACQSKLFRLP